MKGRVIAIHPGAAALMVDGRLEDLLIDGAPDDPSPGDIYVVKVTRKTGKAAAFCEIGNGASGFLKDAKDLQSGDMLLAQVVSLPEAGKAATLSARVLYKERYLILTPGREGVNLSRKIRDEQARANLLDFASDWELDEAGLIIREAALAAQPDDIDADFQTLTNRRAYCASALAAQTMGRCDRVDAAAIAHREWALPRPDLMDQTFEHAGVLDALEALKSPERDLPGSGSMFVEPTRALVAVDVNTKGDFSPAAGLKANLAAASDLPRQLRLLGLGGQILVDFAPFPQKNRRDLETAIKRAFAIDGIETSLVGWTKMGLFELQRKRERRPTAAFINQI